MEFDPRKINFYSIDQLKQFISDGIVSFPDMQKCGLNYMKQDEIRKWNEEQEKKKEEEKLNKEKEEKEIKMQFDAACGINTIQAYDLFINKYEENETAAQEVVQAKMRRDILIEEIKGKRQKLLDDMKAAPWRYTAEIMSLLFSGVKEEQREILRNADHSGPDAVIYDFLLSGMTLDYESLLENGIIPPDVSKKDICEPDYRMPQKTIDKLGEFPTGRTDVYFLGVPRSGKSSVLSGIMYELYIEGKAAYEPHFVNGVDPCSSYYSGLIKAMAQKKPPVGTPTDSISFMKLNIRNEDRRNEVTIVELSGEAFRGIAEGMETEDAREIWSKLGATQCLRVPNKKCLFFVVDYSVVRNFDNAYCNNIDQAMMLDNALRVFCYDGPNQRKPQVDCTMSKVETVAIIMTKCDLMENVFDRNGRLDEAEKYIEEHFSTFANNLLAVCRRFGINRSNRFQPYILTFSLGKFYVGNTVVFESNDSEEIIKFISTVTPSVNNERTNWFNF